MLYKEKSYRQRGFTLIEMMVAIAVLGIIIAVVIPNFSRVIAQNKTTTAANDILILTQSARLEAMRTRKNAIVCASRDGKSCAGNDWSRAIMFVDEDKNGNLNGDEKIKSRAEALSDDLVFTSLGTNKIIFNSNGFMDTNLDDTQVFRVCSTMAPNITKTLNVGLSMGRTKVIRDDNSNHNCG